MHIFNEKSPKIWYNLSMEKEELLLKLSALNNKDKEDILTLFDEQNKVIIELKYKLFLCEELLKLRNKEKYAKKAETSLGPLFDEFELDKSMAELEEKIEEAEEKVSSYTRKKKANLVNEDNANIPVEVINVTSEDKQLIDINSDIVTRRLVVIPRQFKILEIHVHQYKKILANGTSEIVKIDNPYANPLGKTMVSTSLVSSIIVNKVINALPLYRQELDFKREGINLTRQDMSNYVYQAYDIVSNVINNIKDYILSSEVMRSDETPLNIINKDGKKLEGKTNSYVWVLSTGKGYHPSSLYLLGPGRGKEVLDELFSEKKPKYLQSDGYNVYGTIEGVNNVYCLAHIRRKFYALIDKKSNKDSISKQIVSMIDEIYHSDNEITKKYQDDYEKIKEERNNLLLEKCNKLFECIQNEYDKCLVQSSIGKALSYALKCQDGFMNVFKDGRLELDNNASERKVKMFVIGRKNWLFANTVKGAKISCGLYSLLRTAVENNLKPFEYLDYLLNELGPLNEKERIDKVESLLPWSNQLPDYIKLKDLTAD